MSKRDPLRDPKVAKAIKRFVEPIGKSSGISSMTLSTREGSVTIDAEAVQRVKRNADRIISGGDPVVLKEGTILVTEAAALMSCTVDADKKGPYAVLKLRARLLPHQVAALYELMTTDSVSLSIESKQTSFE